MLSDAGGKNYHVESVIAVVWNMCDGIKTIDNIVDSFSEKDGTKKGEVKDAVLRIIAQLERIGLLERAD